MHSTHLRGCENFARSRPSIVSQPLTIAARPWPPRVTPRRAWAAAALLAALAAPAPGFAAVTAEEVNGRIAAINNRADLGEALKTQILQTYQQALGFVEATRQSEATIAEYQTSMTAGADTVRKLNEKIVKARAKSRDAAVTAGEKQLSIDDLEHLSQTAESDKASRERELAELQLAEETLADRVERIRVEKPEAMARINQIEVELARLPKAASGPLAKAQHVLLAAETMARAADVNRLDQELLTHAMRSEIAAAKRKLAAAKLEQVTARAAQLDQLLLERRRQDALSVQEEVARTVQETRDSHPLSREIAATNAALSSEINAALEGEHQAQIQRAQIVGQRTWLNAEFERAQQRLRLAGYTTGFGRIFIDQRRGLPSARAFTRPLAARRRLVAEISLRRLELEEQLRDPAPVDQQAQMLLADYQAVNPQAPAMPKDREELERLIAEQTRLHTKLEERYSDYLRALGDLEFEQQQYLEAANAYAGYLDEHLLWIPNTEPLDAGVVPRLLAALGWLFRPANWARLIVDLWSGLAHMMAVVAAGLIVIAAILRARRKLRATSHEIATRAHQWTTEGMRDTAIEYLIVLVRSLPGPLLLGLAALTLRASPDVSEFSYACARGCETAAWLLLIFRGIIQTLAAKGLARDHFGWPDAVVREARRSVIRLMAMVLPALTVVALCETQGNTDHQMSLGRLSFIGAMLALSVSAYFLVRPDGPLVRHLETRHPRAWLTRFRLAWGLLLPALPLVLAVLAAAGFYYTALELNRHQLATFLLLVAGLLLHSTAVRALALAENRLALQCTQVPPDTGPPAAVAGPVERVPRETTVDMATIDTQTRLLLANVIGWGGAISLFFIWHEVLPALAVLDDIHLWAIAGAADATGAIQAVTASSLLLALVIGVITVIAARNLPGVLEIAVLQRLALQHGSRYAATSLAQYVIIAIGMTLFLGTLGLRWSQIQWLIAALGVGLGFGLQEIFANFISGLILLFERPIRVGDTVTIGDLSGKVSRIRIRATTIIDWDNKEIVVPNKNFITERFVNWTLSDTVTRVKITIGIAYGADTDKALNILLEAAHANPKVMREPAPRAFFVNFGESAIELQLHVHIRDLYDRLVVVHELNSTVKKDFAAHGIEIPYPQRDIHIR